MVQVFYNDQYFCDGYGVDTREKARDIAESLGTNPIEGIELVSPEAATEEHFTLAHHPRYARAILTGRPDSWADRNGLGEWSRDLARSVAMSTGGVIAAVQDALANGRNSGSLSSGLHHARYEHGAGFCTINGLFVGAREAMRMGAQRVMIVDFDAHCGGGTASLLTPTVPIEQIDVSVSYYDHYESSPAATLWMTDGEGYLSNIAEAMAAVHDPTTIDLVLYNAGMDPHERCSTGGAKGITTEVLAERERMVFEWSQKIGTPVAFVLAGGYSGRSLTRAELVDLHRLTLRAASTTHPFVTI